MSLMRFRIFAVVAAFALISACQREAAKDTTADPEPFWQAKPSIPYKPNNFCSTTERLMVAMPASANFRCQGNLEGALGARVDIANVQVVLLQGAKSEWFMFAYELQKGGRSAVDDKMLQRLQNEIEKTLQEPSGD